ncbi:hypothetical protein Poli38472_001511 [Pythium oligandrum]|uniref:WDR59/RTC1-like RING zinc finger domain-containing protein n=1 Tax=Pythium oligandrum TaxID=41045 RepID=A0A8K1CTL1_PYTOL|nr:hypothetical protein Poli38472_001511 [Pythium oligandrum]|eukprot:TMW69355.1 hypothetical protein Poli38472_001511 [Pythium oligandrum]
MEMTSPSLYDPTAASALTTPLADADVSAAALHAAAVSSSSAASTIHSNITAKYDFHAGALSIDATGAIGVLAGRKGLHLVDLEAPYVPMSTIHHQTKWDVTVVKCNPHALFKSHVASTSNHNTLIWNIAHASGGQHATTIGSAPSAQPLVATLRAHTRPVNDLSWCPAEPTILATCSADTKTHLWDLRTPQRPVQTLRAFTTSAVQVEWNRIDPTSLATAHEGEVRVWDTRTGDKGPAVLITAHMQKIYGIDWHPRRMYELLTCSEDKTVKFWDVTQPRAAQGSLTTGAPVWRARYTPFGDALVTSFHRLDNTVRLWSLSHSEPSGVAIDQVHAFGGHTDTVKSFAWRERPNAGGYQLVSWSKDQELRMWRVDSQHLEACGYDTAANTEISTEPTEMLRTEMTQLQHVSKYDLAVLKNDFTPLVVPSSAVPLSATEYTLESNDPATQGVLTFEDDLSKIGEAHLSSDEEDDDVTSSSTRDLAADANVTASREKRSTSASTSASMLPCPRISGACFSGPNMLLVFDSRVAIGQTRTTAAAPTTVAPGKAIKPSPTPLKLPRTYEQLLEMRDSRFAKKKNKKPPVKLLGSTNVIGALDLSSMSEWTVPSSFDLLETSGYNDDGSGTIGAGTGNSTMYFHPAMGSELQMPPGSNTGDIDLAVHGGSEYLKMYFTNNDFHMPVNHPDHRISVPPSAGAGTLSPRSSTLRATQVTNERAKRMEQTALNLDLSLSVTVLDLSRLCGISSVLTYETQLHAPVSTGVQHNATKQLDAGTRDLVEWMLQSADSGSTRSRRRRGTRRGKEPQAMSRILNSLLAGQDSESSDEKSHALHGAQSISDLCAHNSRVAALAGRSDLQQVWSLLELSTASSVALPMTKTEEAASNVKTRQETRPPSPTGVLSTAHPWSAHPFGQNLVNKMLHLYEQSGDLPALASIVCALRQPTPPETDIRTPQEAVPPMPMGFSLGQQALSHPDSTGGSTKTATSIAFARHRTSFNGISQFLSSSTTTATTDSIESAPAMRSARRSSSHNEVPKLSLKDRVPPLGEKDSPTMSALKMATDWSLLRGMNRMPSPGTTSASNWKIEAEKMESPLKTWNGRATKDSSPRPLTHEAFRSPLAMSASGRTMESMLSLAYRRDGEEEDVAPRGRLFLQVENRSSADDNSLLSADPADEERYDGYKAAYAELLYRYGAMSLRSDVLKALSQGESDNTGLTYAVLCRSCQMPTDGLYCGSCRDFSVKCSICQLVVRGQSMFCMTCGHGGHEQHLRAWFETENACPTGCGCWCKQATGTNTSAIVMDDAAVASDRMQSRSYSF